MSKIEKMDILVIILANLILLFSDIFLPTKFYPTIALITISGLLIYIWITFIQPKIQK